VEHHWRASRLIDFEDASCPDDRRFLLPFGEALGTIAIDVDTGKFLTIVIVDGDLPVTMFPPPIAMETAASWGSLLLLLGHAPPFKGLHYGNFDWGAQVSSLDITRIYQPGPSERSIGEPSHPEDDSTGSVRGMVIPTSAAPAACFRTQTRGGLEGQTCDFLRVGASNNRRTKITQPSWNFPSAGRVLDGESQQRRGEGKMVMQLEHERNIEDLGKHTTESVDRLRQLLAGGAQVYPDPKRPDFYEVESGSDVYYIHISPVTGKIFLLATWKADFAAESAGVHQAA
jgi:hypothetical protein